MLNDGLVVMVIGMGTVFSFLVILVLATMLSAKFMVFFNKICPEAVLETAPVKVAKSNDEEIAIVIASAKRFN